MFAFLKGKSSKSDISPAPPLYFKDNNAAFEYACRYLDCRLSEGRMLPALIVDARKQFGTPVAVKREPDGTQLATLQIASADDGFIVLARSAGVKGPALQPGQLVAWQASKYIRKIAAQASDKRFAWLGFIVGTLKPAFIDGCWLRMRMLCY